MNNTKHDRQDQFNHQQNQQQKTKQEHGPKKQGQQPNMLHKDRISPAQEHEYPELRMTR